MTDTDLCLTLAEAEELIDDMGGFSDDADGLLVEATVFNSDIQDVRERIESFMSSLGRPVDPASITIRPDRIEDMDVPCVSVVVQLRR